MKLLEQLFDEDIYADFPADLFEFDRTGFNLPEQVLGLIDEVRPSRVIEVGTWKGNSAFWMADRLKALGVEFEMICVDTWLGSSEMWLVDRRSEIAERRNGLGLYHGYPTLYFQFLANVVKLGHQGSIVPLPVTSNIAYEVLVDLNYRAPFIFIDGSHSAVDVANDVDHYWELVEPGGILCGDDYHSTVKAVVDAFAARAGLAVGEMPGEYSWHIRKS
jgi:hypothetical protein